MYCILKILSISVNLFTFSFFFFHLLPYGRLKGNNAKQTAFFVPVMEQIQTAFLQIQSVILLIQPIILLIHNCVNAVCFNLIRFTFPCGHNRLITRYMYILEALSVTEPLLLVEFRGMVS